MAVTSIQEGLIDDKPFEFEVYGEDDQGREGSCTIDVSELFESAAVVIREKDDEIVKLQGVCQYYNGQRLSHSHFEYEDNPNMTYVGCHPTVADKHICISDLKGLIMVETCWIEELKSLKYVTLCRNIN